ncbi:MAG TPA: hypothetical protein VFC19_48560 [Candidatus Limnocylindrales bacterium]|nr:hypothetical protein [Candidatus Limnocylindrales bacterium]
MRMATAAPGGALPWRAVARLLLIEDDPAILGLDVGGEPAAREFDLLLFLAGRAG